MAIPVTVFVSVILVVVFLMYLSGKIRSLPCGSGVNKAFMRHFVHIDPMHLLINLYAFYVLSRVEVQMGSGPFLGLLVFLLIVNMAIEVVLHILNPEFPCSIGFSGILFGIAAWELFVANEVNTGLLLLLAAMVINPSLQNPRASLLGHSIGAIAGVIGALLWNKLRHK
jgi:membrane associated rhomboid family serine protease